MVGPGYAATVCAGAGTEYGEGTEAGAGCVPGQQGVLGWPVQHGAAWVGCPGHAGNPAPVTWPGQGLLACGA